MRAVDKFIALALLSVFAGAATAQASGLKVALLSEAEVRGDSIFLSDLLPSSVPAGVRDSAEKILIATTPQLGTMRILDRTMIADLLSADRVFGEVEIPPQIVVRRAGRLITREEVVAAIRVALNSNEFSNIAAIAPEDIRMSAPVMVSTPDAELQVTRMDFDPALKQSRFLLISRADRRIMPFMVTARLHASAPVLVASSEMASSPGHIATIGDPRESQGASSVQGREQAGSALLGRSSLERAAPGDGAGPNQFGSAVLVESGKPATLRLLSGSMLMLLNVLPLERGVLGQKIRVKLPVTGKILQGQVVGAGRLEAAF